MGEAKRTAQAKVAINQEYTADEKRRIEKAASIIGSSVATFIRQAALEKAHSLLK